MPGRGKSRDEFLAEMGRELDRGGILLRIFFELENIKNNATSEQLEKIKRIEQRFTKERSLVSAEVSDFEIENMLNLAKKILVAFESDSAEYRKFERVIFEVEKDYTETIRQSEVEHKKYALKRRVEGIVSAKNKIIKDNFNVRARITELWKDAEGNGEVPFVISSRQFVQALKGIKSYLLYMSEGLAFVQEHMMSRVRTSPTENWCDWLQYRAEIWRRLCVEYREHGDQTAESVELEAKVDTLYQKISEDESHGDVPTAAEAFRLAGVEDVVFLPEATRNEMCRQRFIEQELCRKEIFSDLLSEFGDMIGLKHGVEMRLSAEQIYWALRKAKMAERWHMRAVWDRGIKQFGELRHSNGQKDYKDNAMPPMLSEDGYRETCLAILNEAVKIWEEQGDLTVEYETAIWDMREKANKEMRGLVKVYRSAFVDKNHPAD